MVTQIGLRVMDSASRKLIPLVLKDLRSSRTLYETVNFSESSSRLEPAPADLYEWNVDIVHFFRS